MPCNGLRYIGVAREMRTDKKYLYLFCGPEFTPIDLERAVPFGSKLGCVPARVRDLLARLPETWRHRGRAGTSSRPPPLA